jgi:hypothetical protein
MDKHIIQFILENAGFDCQSYSGRGMNGKNCLGFVFTNKRVLLADLTLSIIEIMDNENYDQSIYSVPNALYDMKTDNLGKDMIGYFPNITFVMDDYDSDTRDSHLNDEEDNE